MHDSKGTAIKKWDTKVLFHMWRVLSDMNCVPQLYIMHNR